MQVITRKLALVSLVAGGLLACKGEEPASTEQPVEPSPEAAATTVSTPDAPLRELALSTPSVDDSATKDPQYPFTAGEAIDSAVYHGIYGAMRELNTRLGTSNEVNGAPAAPAGVVEQGRPRGAVVTVWHTSNVRGEREDCGCKKNPRGGLSRKATLIKQLDAKEAPDGPDGRLIVDAGGLLFKSTRTLDLSERAQKQATIEAEAVVDAFNIIGCDAFLVGQRDLSMNVTKTRALSKRANFPFITANVLGIEGGGPLFKTHVVTESAGKKWFVTGVTKPGFGKGAEDERRLGILIDEPKKHLLGLQQTYEASGAAGLILLSNLGMAATETLVKELMETPMKPALVVVSGTARSTFTPVWVDDVPMVESGSRGKALGRADMHIVDGKVAFQPDETGQVKLVRNYMNSYRSLHLARRNLARESRREKRDPRRITRLERNHDLALKRLETLEGRLTDIEPTSEKNADASWLSSRLLQVELAIDEDESVRAVLDKHIKRVEALPPVPTTKRPNKKGLTTLKARKPGLGNKLKTITKPRLPRSVTPIKAPKSPGKN